MPSVDRALRPQLLDAYLTLDAFADARTTLTALKARGFSTAILSNGSPRMLDAAVEASGMAGLFDAVLSVDAVGVYKPRAEVYALVTNRFGVKPGGSRIRLVEPMGRHGRGRVRLSPALGQSRADAGRICRAAADAGRARSVGRGVARLRT